MGIEKARWYAVARASLGLAVLSLLFNISLPPEMSGHWQVWSFLRKTITKVLSSGTVWAGIAVYAGWKLARPLAAFVGGIVASEATLLVHYLLGRLIGIYDSNVLSGNSYWFIGGAIVCGPLGLVGWLASRRGRLGVVARLVVPAGALAEPFVLQYFSHPFPQIPWPERWSDTSSGIILVAMGLAGVLAVLRRGRTREPGRVQRL